MATLGSSQNVADAHLRHLAAVEKEIKTFADEIRRLRKMCNKMIEAKHFDSTQVIIYFIYLYFILYLVINTPN